MTASKMRRMSRLLQYLTGIHRIHHIMYAYGWRLPFIGVAYFPPWSVRDSSRPSGRSTTYRYGWRRVKPNEYHDCTTTGVR